MPPTNHTRLIILCITVLAAIAGACGTWLLWKGFAGGEGLAQTLNTAIAGMLGFLAHKSASPPPSSPPPPAAATP